MSLNSRQKGARGEREWAEQLNANGYAARRGQQFAGGCDSPDVICEPLPHVHFEVKRVEALNVGRAMEQAQRDANGSKVPVVAHKRNHGPWLVTILAEDFFRMARLGINGLSRKEIGCATEA